MKRYLICFLLSSLIFPVMSQEDHIDRRVKKETELREMGCCKNAVEYYQNSLGVYPESVIIYFEMAYNYACSNDIEKSIEYTQKAMTAYKESKELMKQWVSIIAEKENEKEKEKPQKEKEEF